MMKTSSLSIRSLEIGRMQGGRRPLLVAATALVLGGCAALGFAHPKLLTVGEVVAMSRAGEPADAIIAKMRESGTVYRLSASQLAKLHDEGLPDAVVDYMQETYLASVRRRQELEDWSYWTGVDGYWYGGLPYGWPDEWIGLPYVSSPRIATPVERRRGDRAHDH